MTPDATNTVARDLVGMVALVTGAGQGNGRAIALRLARGGAAVAVNDLREDTAGSVVDEIRALGETAVAISPDVRDVRQIEARIHQTVSELGRLDLLANN